MKKGLIALAALSASSLAFGQTTTTRCYEQGQTLNCTSQTASPGVDDQIANVGWKAFNQGRQSASRVAPPTTAPSVNLSDNFELISAEAAIIRRAFFDIADAQTLLPPDQRMTQEQFSAALEKRIRADLGRQPAPRSMDVAYDQISAIQADREARQAANSPDGNQSPRPAQ